MIHDIVRLNESGTATLECFVLDNQISTRATKTRPAMVICPGGAYLKLAHREAEPVAARFLGMGYDAFILRYPVYVTSAPSALTSGITTPNSTTTKTRFSSTRSCGALG